MGSSLRSGDVVGRGLSHSLGRAERTGRGAPLPGGQVFGTLLMLLLSVPFGIRAANAWHHDRPLPASYLPALEHLRERADFDPAPLAELGSTKPGYVVIGDSMAGTRIDEERLGELAGQPVTPLIQQGSGSAFWYLALKNWVVPSGAKPRAVFIFFRDTNLTDVLYRLDDQFRWSVDLVAQAVEPELNAVIASRIGGSRLMMHRAVEEAYHSDRARAWAEPALTTWLARIIEPSHRRRLAFLWQMNERFGLEHLRQMDAADVQTDDPSADFDRYVDRSVLPLMLRDAQRAGLRLCFVRVQRRPIGGRPPEQSIALRRYVGQLRAYLEAHGATWRDDTGDPAITLDMYKDGDHIGGFARRRYTEIFFDRLRPLFQ